MQANALPSGAFRPARPASDYLRRAFAQFSDVFTAIGDGVQNARDYKNLVNQGVNPQEAARRVFETIRK